MADESHRFDGRAVGYDRYRERYDAELVLSRLRAWCGLRPEWQVADVGAGTGMLADVFLANGNQVTAVEPNAEMRGLCTALHDGVDALTVVEGRAEATGLAAESVDVVAAGRAFHWFDVDGAMREFGRILRPGGWLVMVSFGRATGGPEVNREIEALLRSFGADRTSTRAVYAKYVRLPEFLEEGFHYEELEGRMTLNREELLGLLGSISHAPRVDEARYGELVEGCDALFERYGREGVVTIATRYWINVGRLRRRVS